MGTMGYWRHFVIKYDDKMIEIFLCYNQSHTCYRLMKKQLKEMPLYAKKNIFALK